MTIVLIVSGVLFFVFSNTQRQTDYGLEALDYIRKATILLEQLKQDIRASLHETGAVAAKGPTATVERNVGKKVAKVEYRYDAQSRCVVRTEDGYRKTYGGDGSAGGVVFFACDEVKRMPGFYKIEVRFETYQKRANAARCTANYTFEALVNKRARENEADVKWKYAFDDV